MKREEKLKKALSVEFDGILDELQSSSKSLFLVAKSVRNKKALKCVADMCRDLYFACEAVKIGRGIYD